MSHYDYRKGKERVEEILKNKVEIIENDEIPKNDNFVDSVAYYGWISAIVITIRNLKDLFETEEKEKVLKIIKAFTTEILGILKEDNNLRQIMIRDGAIYAIYTTPTKIDTYEIYEKSVVINTYMKMLNKLFEENYLPLIEVGVGIGTSKELVLKVNRGGKQIDDFVWLGDTLKKTEKLSSLVSKENSIAISRLTYINIIDRIISENTKNAKKWFRKEQDETIGYFYVGNVVKSDFRNWINGGMEESSL